MRGRSIVVVIGITLVVLLSACGDDGNGDQSSAASDPTELPSATELAGAADTTAEPPGEAEAETEPPEGPEAIEVLDYEVVDTIAHDTTAFTQGLLLSDDGRLFEATGYDATIDASTTTVREVDPDTGEVLRSISLGRDYFGEGLALVDDRLIQLTWTEQLAFVYDIETFQQVGAYAYNGEGWGLCHDEPGDRLVMSNGTAALTFRDADNFGPISEIQVTRDGVPVERLNELECVDGEVWANVWQTDEILRIDPATGAVTGVLDLSGIIDPDPADTNGNAVLNGIAYDADAGTFLVTGKLWPTVFEIRIDAD